MPLSLRAILPRLRIPTHDEGCHEPGHGRRSLYRRFTPHLGVMEAEQLLGIPKGDLHTPAAAVAGDDFGRGEADVRADQGLVPPLPLGIPYQDELHGPGARRVVPTEAGDRLDL